MKQPVFNFPPLLERIRIGRLINKGNYFSLALALDSLSDFYGVSRVTFSWSVDEFYRRHKEDFLSVLASYGPKDKRIVFKGREQAMDRDTVVHEFYHHVEHERNIPGVKKGPAQTATAFARTFWDLPVLLLDLCWPEMDDRSREIAALVDFVNSGPSQQELKAYRNEKRLSFLVPYDRNTRQYYLKPEAREAARYARKILGIRGPKKNLVRIVERKK